MNPLIIATNRIKEAEEIYAKLKKSENSSMLSNMTQAPVQGFYKNENYTTMVLTETINSLDEKINIYGIYGEDDGLFDEDHFNKLKNAIGKDNFVLLENASHSVFIDRQNTFIKFVENWCK